MPFVVCQKFIKSAEYVVFIEEPKEVAPGDVPYIHFYVVGAE